MVARQFNPSVYETCHLLGETYVVQPHPAAPTLRYAQVGSRGRVFQLQHQRNRQLWALKVFNPKYRVSSLLTIAEQLSLVASYEGMRAAKRRIILPSDPVVSTHPNLEYAMIMPWINGKTWHDFLVDASKSGRQLSLGASLRLCRRFLEVLASLENSGMAHTDLAPGNVVFELNSCDVQLLDLEDMYMPAASNAKVAKGSKGYRHPSGDVSSENFWRAEGDRYAAAVLAAEILVLANQELAGQATDEGFFADHRFSPQADTRFGEAKAWLLKVAPAFATVFERAWMANTIGQCPRVSELYVSAREAADNEPQPYHFDVQVLARNAPTHDFVKWHPHSPTTTQPTTASPFTWHLDRPSSTPVVQKRPVVLKRFEESLERVLVIVGVGAAVTGLLVFLMWLLLRFL